MVREPPPFRRRCSSCARRHFQRAVELPRSVLPALIDAIERVDVEALVALLESGGVALDAMQVADLVYLVCPTCWVDGRFDVFDHDHNQWVDPDRDRPLGTIVLEGSALRRLVEAAERERSSLLLRRWRYRPATVDCPQCRGRMPAVPILWGKPDMRSPGVRGAIQGGCLVARRAPKVGCVRCDWPR